MEEKRDFILPEASEKLSYRFILDSIKEQTQKRETSESLVVEEAPSETLCGTSAPKETSQRDLIQLKPLPEGKKYFRIGEVASLLKVEAYVLRYWESEFKTIKPVKAGSGHRVYSRKDVETLQVIKHLLYNEKFSIKGAKKKLQETKKEVKAVSHSGSQTLKEVASELKELIHFLRSNSL